MTQNQLILSHLKTNKGITAMEALNQYGCFRLAARINDLRNDGHDITTETIKTLTNKTVSQYKLNNHAKN